MGTCQAWQCSQADARSVQGRAWKLSGFEMEVLRIHAQVYIKGSTTQDILKFDNQ